jgi:micrococcal nuclease
MKPVIIIAIVFLVIAVIGISYAVQEITLMQTNNILEDYGDETPVKKSECLGTARCFEGTVTQVIDGDTIKVDGQSIRFALASAPELNEFGGDTARDFIQEICPVGSTVLVDEDDRQTKGSYGRIIGVIFCNDLNLNEELVGSGLGDLTIRFCDTSEFSNHIWAQKHGC